MTNILFVCTGNTCRSPMAEALAKHKAPDLHVQSAGVFAAVGSPASMNTVKALEENGIGIDHKSKQITKELVDWADLIFTMTTSHKQLVGEHFPSVLDKLFTIKEYTDFLNHDVVDPYGGPMEEYKQTYKELDEAIDVLIKKIGN
jgi:protein arginine phosphatase